jgi:hypothetical protein
VTPAYAAPAWASFATAVATAAATLTGLLFVAVSINLQRILQYPNLPGRAAQTLVMFSLPLVFSILMLVPGQPVAVLAGEPRVAVPDMPVIIRPVSRLGADPAHQVGRLAFRRPGDSG